MNPIISNKHHRLEISIHGEINDSHLCMKYAQYVETNEITIFRFFSYKNKFRIFWTNYPLFLSQNGFKYALDKCVVSSLALSQLRICRPSPPNAPHPAHRIGQKKFTYVSEHFKTIKMLAKNKFIFEKVRNIFENHEK